MKYIELNSSELKSPTFLRFVPVNSKRVWTSRNY